MAVTPPPRTHRPVWTRDLCRPCKTCSRQCPAVVFPEQAEETDSLRGMVARKSAAVRPLETPPCVQACPLGQDVPGYLQAEARGDFDQALAIVHQTNPFASVCGKLCHHPCMRACMRGHIDNPIQIRALKRSAMELGAARPVQQGGQEGRVAVVGAGPAGLSAAYFLARLGRPVTVYEAADQPGGLLRQVIPAFDLPPKALEADLDFILRSGVGIELGARIGSAAELKSLIERGARAVVLAVGAQEPRTLGIPGQDLEGCHHAISFSRIHSQGEGPRLAGPLVVAGSGVMAASAARMAVRAGASSVSLLYKRDRRNPTAEPEGIGLAEQEGVQIRLGTRPVELTGDKAVRSVRCQSPDGEIELEAAVFIDAEKRDPDLSWLGLSLTKKGTLEIDDQAQSTSMPGVFVAGESVTGPRNVIRAIANGMQVAQQVNRFLSGDQP